MAVSPRRILAAMDDSGRGRRVAEEAIALAEAFGAELTVLHIIDSPLYPYGHNDVLAPGVAKAQFLAYVRNEAMERGHQLAACVLSLAACSKVASKAGNKADSSARAKAGAATGDAVGDPVPVAVSVHVEIAELSGNEGIVDRILTEAAIGGYDLLIVGASSPRRLPILRKPVVNELIARASCPVVAIR